MARTQAADYDEKREAIMRGAGRLFAQKGFAGASISDLASACGMSKSLIYHYYASKEAILYDVMHEHIDELLEAVEAVAIDDQAPGEAFHALTRALLAHYAGAADQQKVLLYELDWLPEKERREIVEKQRRIVAHTEEVLTIAKPSMMKDRTARRAKTMLYFGMLNWSHSWFNPEGAISRDGLADMAADIILGGE